MLISLYLSYVFIAIALLTSLTVYLRPTSIIYLKIFPLFLIIIAILGSIIGYLSWHNKSNTILYNFFTTLEFVFYFFVLKEVILNRQIKKIIFFVLLIYPIITFLNIFLIQKMTVFNSVTYSIGCLLIVTFSISYFFELFQLVDSINLLLQPAFWICSGLLFYFSCTFPLFGLANFIKSPPKIIWNNLAIISNLLDVLLYSSFTIAFLCRIKIKRSTL